MASDPGYLKIAGLPEPAFPKPAETSIDSKASATVLELLRITERLPKISSLGIHWCILASTSIVSFVPSIAMSRRPATLIKVTLYNKFEIGPMPLWVQSYPRLRCFISLKRGLMPLMAAYL